MFILLSALSVAAQAPATDTTQKDEDPVICHRQESEVGTHMRPKKICMHKSDWDIIEDHTRREMQSLHDRRTDPGMADGHSPPPK
jgi:hypothetical protein